MKAYKPPFSIKFRTSAVLNHDRGLGMWVLIDTATNLEVESHFDAGLGRHIGGIYHVGLDQKLNPEAIQGAPPTQLLQDLIELNKPSHEHYKSLHAEKGFALMGKNNEVVREEDAQAQ